MAAITSNTESWNGHTFSEVESHLKNNYITDAYTKDDLTGTSAVTVAKASSASTASSLSTSTASTVAANDFILLESANGTPVRISRDSFVQAMASVLNSNSQSTISQLFGADTNGNHAAINMSNLATVMGITAKNYSFQNDKQLSATDDLYYLLPGAYSWGMGSVPQHCPFVYTGQALVFNVAGGQGLILLIKHGVGAMYAGGGGIRPDGTVYCYGFAKIF